MPLYEYECQKCHRRIEKIQSFSAEPLKTCEQCGGPLEKLISAPAFQFKGSGWYATDYAHSGVSPHATGERKSDDHDSGSKDSGDSKPAATDAAAGLSAPSSNAATKPASTTSDK